MNLFADLKTKKIVALLFFSLCLIGLETLATVPPLPPVSGEPAGYLAGSFGVSETGAATYTVDLAVPPGTGGMAPKLALVYDSQGRSSILGIGWSLSGLSAITRCGTTLAQDGFIDGVDFDGNDKFCLDGQRLIAVNGAYGADGTEYRTENETFSRVFSYGTAGSGPARFTVEMKNGLTYHYGTTADSRIEAQGKTDVLLWQVDKVEDTVGNYFTVTYYEDNSIGESYPLRIDYTGNSAQGLSPYNSVRFEYENREDVVPHFLSGSKVQLTKRLNKVSMYSGSHLAWEYELTYEETPTTPRSHLIRIVECDSNGTCLEPTELEWQKEPISAFGSRNEDSTGGYNFSEDYHERHIADVNGDGMMDLVYFAATQFSVFLSQGDGTFGSIIISNTGGINFSSQFHERHMVDVNGDGMADAMYFAATQFSVFLSQGDGTFGQLIVSDTGGINFSSQFHQRRLADVNGDGMTDVVYVAGTQLSVFLSQGDGTFGQLIVSDTDGINFSSSSHERHVSDVNGDGMVDVIYIAATQISVFLSYGNGYFGSVIISDTDGLNFSSQFHERHMADVNGDGNADVIYFAATQFSVFLSQGDGTFGSVIISDTSGINFSSQFHDRHMADVNGDGMADAFFLAKYQFSLFPSRGDGTFGPFVVDDTGGWSFSSASYKWRMADVNGDGNTDVLYIASTGFSSFLSQYEPDLLKTITSGHGPTTTIEYKPLSDSTIYTKANDAVFPIRDLQGPMYVVSAYETDNGIGGTSRMSYHYEGLKAHVQGRGFCGFREVTATNEETGIQTTTFYRQDHPYKSMAYKKEVRLADGTLLNRTQDTWSVTNYAHGGYLPHVTQSVVEEYEIDGSLTQTTTTNKTFDTYGNVTQIGISHGDGHWENTVNTYTDDLSKWHLGRLTRSVVTKQAPGQPAQTRISSFTYNANTGLLETETTEPDHPTLKLTKTYTHDGFGNILTSTVSGPGLAPRTQTSVYHSRGQFAVQNTNALGHTESRVYGLRHGKVVSLTGPNGLTTTWTYDGFGRLEQETRADGTETRTVRFMAESGAPTHAVYYVRTDSSGSPPSITYYDLLDREIRRVAVGFDGTDIFVDTVYNARGEVAQVSDPYFEGETPFWTVNQYDVIGRLVQVTSPGNRVSTTDYQGHTVTATNPLGQTSTRVVNDLGQLVESRDNAGNSIFFTYDSRGNLIEMADPAGNTTAMQYDIRGNKISMTDPDSGTTTYSYDALGQLLSQTDAKLQTAVFTYDKLGRMLTRQEPEGASTWTYDTQPYGIGKLASVTSAGDHSETYSYDSLGRPSHTTTTIGSTQYVVGQTYDQFGRLETLSYPSGFTLAHEYNAQGFLEKVRNHGTGALYWQANAVNARGQLENQSLGNGLVTAKVYDSATGFVQNIQTGAIQDLVFDFDAIGNLTQRQDLLIGAVEDFDYDLLNRLTTATVLGQTPLGMTYDALGNILSMTGVGSYAYGENGAGPHAVTSIVGAKANSYAYDANGNRTGSVGGSVLYTSYNKPYSIAKAATTLQFSYGASRSRYRQTVTTNSIVDKTKVYLGGIYEEETGPTSTKKIHYIRGGNDTVVIYTTETGQADTTRYLHKDHLGSIQTISDESGNTVEVLSFDAWGNRRNPTDWSPVTAPVASSIDRGFTGHEQLDQVGLIHMNGRVYDPVIGRFLSADPNIQAPENTQSLNRYSYVLNNPLSFTDPSGFFFKKIFKAVARFVKEHKAVIIGAVVGFATGVWISGNILSSFGYSTVADAIAANASTALFASAVGGGAAGGFAGAASSTIAAGGSPSDAFRAGLRGGFFGGVSGGLFNKIGANFSGFERIVAHGVAGGALSIAQGGKFQHGFISSAGVALLGPNIGEIDKGNPGINPYRTAAAAILGGTLAEISGGKFANGAITAAFARMFNEEQHQDRTEEVKKGPFTTFFRRLANLFDISSAEEAVALTNCIGAVSEGDCLTRQSARLDADLETTRTKRLSAAQATVKTLDVIVTGTSQLPDPLTLTAEPIANEIIKHKKNHPK